MDIQVAAGSSLPNPAAGYRTIFINTENNNLLSYKFPDGTITVVTDADGIDEECCACEISKTQANAIACALQSGIITSAEYQAILNTGLVVDATETIDPVTGAKSCSVSIGTKNSTVLSIAITGDSTVSIGSYNQLTATVTPTGSSGVIWVSSNPSVAAVSASGLVLGISAGTATIYAYASTNTGVFKTKVITVS